MKRSGVDLVIAIVLLTASIGFGKAAAIRMGSFTPASIATNGFYLASLACLGLQAIVWQRVLEHHALSFAYSVMTVVYASTLVLSAFVFHEHVAWSHIAGAGLIVSGVVVVTRNRQRSSDG